MALVTVIASGALAACGSSSSTTSSTTASASASGSTSGAAAGGGANSARRAQLVSCLKAHGVTLPSRPAGAPPGGGSGGSSGTGTGTGTTTTRRRGFFFGGGAGGANISPKMRAAFQACGANFGAGGGAFRGRISHTAINNFVACVKQHGYPQMPSPNFSGKGPIFPRTVETNAKFQAASKSCQHLLIPPRPSGGSSGGTSTTSGA
ncbi:MAG TPA: hypothetical protein VLW51_05965 [Solirubrobacteraceae bacterium]|nr:hypothetical protein [Solirubrobacteraceae bacterium]